MRWGSDEKLRASAPEAASVGAATDHRADRLTLESAESVEPLQSLQREIPHGGFFPREADTVTSHEHGVLRRDTLPVGPLEATPDSASDACEPLAWAPDAREHPAGGSPTAGSSGTLSSADGADSAEAVDDSDVIEDDEVDDDTQTEVEPFAPSDEPTSPTLSLANRSDTTREVYRLFLASDYAPALELANELIARGEDDPMLVTIARECGASLASADFAMSHASASMPAEPSSRPTRSPAPSPPASRPALLPPSPPLRASLRPQRAPFSGFDGKMTIEQVAGMSGSSVEHVLGLLERFVAMGVLPLRPPR